MQSEEDDLYFKREQSRIKHEILRKYLQRFARIVGKFQDEIVYVDGFSGPWNTVSSEFEDSSFAIALRELRSARDTVREIYQKDLRIRCVFLEKDPQAYKLLRDYADKQTDVAIKTLNREFEDAVPEIVKLVESGTGRSFPFVLIDPTGWKGFAMDVIAPLIRLQPCEVLVNFMTGYIQRFIEDERDGLKASFRRLYGDDSYETRVEGQQGGDREDAMVECYADRLSDDGGYPFVTNTIVLHPTRDRTYFHLVYATRNLRGIEVFKDAEKKALDLSQTIRADAKKREREQRSQQGELFGGTDLPETSYLEELYVHFEQKAQMALEEFATGKTEVLYDELYAVALRFPMIQREFLNQWLSDQNVKLLGLGNKRKPQIQSDHRVRFPA